MEPANSSIDELPRLLQEHRERLKRLVSFRMDRRLLGRIDPSDVVQEACAEAAQRWSDYHQKREVEPFVWLRFLACQKVVTLHRHHLGREKRTALKEVVFDAQDTSQSIMAHLAENATSPSLRVAKDEWQKKLMTALQVLDPIDREVLALRHFECLSNSETAQALGLAASAASKRYIRALERLRQELGDLVSEFQL